MTALFTAKQLSESVNVPPLGERRFLLLTCSAHGWTLKSKLETREECENRAKWYDGEPAYSATRIIELPEVQA